MRKVLVGAIAFLLFAAGTVYFWPVPTVERVCAGTPEWCREFKELINEAVADVEYSRSTHIHWIQFLEENPNWDTSYVGDSDHQLEWINKYDRVLGILDSCLDLPFPLPAGIDEAIADIREALAIHKWALTLKEDPRGPIAAKIGDPQHHWNSVRKYNQILAVLYRCGGLDGDRYWHRAKMDPPVFYQGMVRWDDGPTLLSTFIVVAPPENLRWKAETTLTQQGFGPHGLIASVLILSRSPDGSELSYPTAWGRVEMNVYELSPEEIRSREFKGWGPASIFSVRLQRK